MARGSGRLEPKTGAAIALMVGLFLAVGCAARRPISTPRDPSWDPGVPPPAWRYEPLSWEKLASVERWILAEGDLAQPHMRIEAELQLAEGRLAFSKHDQQEASVPPESLRVRLEKACEAFDQIAADGDASPGQRARAQIGRSGAQALIQSPVEEPDRLTILPRSRWGAIPAAPSRLTALRGTWSRITVHHSAESTADPRGQHLEASIRALQGIQRFHMESQNYGDIGYHFVIDGSGRILEGRELSWQGAHAGGDGGVNNNQNIGICLLGDFVDSDPTPAAIKSLELLVNELRERYRVPSSRVFPHSDFRVTECPGDDLRAWVSSYRRR